MMFDPYVYTAMTPRSGQMTSIPQPAGQPAPPPAVAACILPFASESLIGDALNPTAVVERELFLLHPSELAFQRMLVGVSQDTNPTFLSVQLIQKRGTEVIDLTTERVIQSLRVVPDVIEDATAWGEGPVFLRLRATYSAAKLLVTVETLTFEVI